MNTDCTEEWKPIPGWTNWQVSNLGRIKGPKKIRTLQFTWDKKRGKRYLFVSFTRNKKTTVVRVHRAVVEAFIGPIPPGKQVNHKNGIKTDNRLDNLEICSPRENIRHSIDNGTSGAKLSIDNVLEIRSSKEPCSYFAKKYYVTKECVWMARKGITFQHVKS